MKPHYFLSLHRRYHLLLLQFWRRYPALLFALVALVAMASALVWSPLYLFIALLLLYPYLYPDQRKRPYPLILAALAAYSYAQWRLPKTPLTLLPIEGKGVFHIDNISISSSPFTRSYCYKGQLTKFTASDGTVYRHLPCTIFHPLSKAPCGNCDYQLQGKLMTKGKFSYHFKPGKAVKWQPISQKIHFAKWRFEAKQAVSSYLHRCLPDRSTASFLSALVTGDLDSRSIRLDFNRLGLQHLLAISGFHFSFFAAFLSVLLRPFFLPRYRLFLLLAACTAYFFFLGSNPSILRAFLALCLYLIAKLLKRRASGLNLLGTALLIEIMISPLSILSLSFQLSFLCTLGLLISYAPLSRLLEAVLPARPYQQILQLSVLDQHGYIFSALLRKSLAINGAVHLFCLPVLLCLFHRFSLLSVIYNLFFPFCVAVSLLLLACALLTAMVLPPLSSLFFLFNTHYTSLILRLAANPPAYFDVVLRTKGLPFPLVVIILFGLFQAALLLHTSLCSDTPDV